MVLYSITFIFAVKYAKNQNQEETFMKVMNTLNVFWSSPLEKMVPPEIAENIRSATDEVCRKQGLRISDIAIGPVNEELVVTCILRHVDDQEELREGLYYVYLYFIEDPGKSRFDFIGTIQIAEGFVYRPFEDPVFIEIGREKKAKP